MLVEPVEPCGHAQDAAEAACGVPHRAAQRNDRPPGGAADHEFALGAVQGAHNVLKPGPVGHGVGPRPRQGGGLKAPLGVEQAAHHVARRLGDDVAQDRGHGRSDRVLHLWQQGQRKEQLPASGENQPTLPGHAVGQGLHLQHGFVLQVLAEVLVQGHGGDDGGR